MTTDRTHKTVGIVGGGIAGLTLARMLELANIPYCLWEAYNSFMPSAGASIGLMPNGLRILDQIGVIGELDVYAVPLESWEHRDAEGRIHATFTSMSQYAEKQVSSQPLHIEFSNATCLCLSIVTDWDMLASLWRDSGC